MEKKKYIEMFGSNTEPFSFLLDISCDGAVKRW